MIKVMLIMVFFAALMLAETTGEAAESKDGAVALFDKFIKAQTEAGKINKEKNGWKTSLPKPPKATFDKNSEYFWVIETNKGKITVKLMPQVGPMHASSTIYLARLGFYHGLSFHRVITDFMAQGG